MVAKLKYAVYPGPVTSKTDGQRHFIPSDILIRLYRVPSEECLVVSRNLPDYGERRKQAIELGLTPLVPRYNGDYAVPAVD